MTVPAGVVALSCWLGCDGTSTFGCIEGSKFLTFTVSLAPRTPLSTNCEPGGLSSKLQKRCRLRAGFGDGYGLVKAFGLGLFG